MNFIADAKTKYFDSKDHYLLMRMAWSKAVNNKEIHLEAYHFMFYNAVRGKNITEGFTSPGLKKLYHQGWVNLKAHEARAELRQIGMARHRKVTIADFIELFDNTLSFETIQQVMIDMPTVPQNLLWINHERTSFEDWALEYTMKNFRENLEANQTPLEPWAREALDLAMKDSATLISEGEFRG